MTRAELAEAIRTMERYLDLKRRQRDWHGVRDAAAELEALEAQLRMVRR